MSKQGFFSQEGLFFRIGSLVFDFIYVSVLWSLFSGFGFFLASQIAFADSSVPYWLAIAIVLFIVFNLGPATTAALYVMNRRNREVCAHIGSDFVKGWKENYKKAAGLSFAFGLILVFIIYALYLEINNPIFFGTIPLIFLIGLQVLFMILMVFVYLYSFALLGRFEMRTFDYVRMSFLMSIKHLPLTLLCGLILAATVLLCYFVPPCLLMLPGISLYLRAVILERVFKKYMPEEKEEKAEEDENSVSSFNMDAERAEIIRRYMGQSGTPGDASRQNYVPNDGTPSGVTIVKDDEKTE